MKLKSVESAHENLSTLAKTVTAVPGAIKGAPKPKVKYDGNEDPTPCEVCGLDTLNGDRYCSYSCEEYAKDYCEDLEFIREVSNVPDKN